MKQETSEFTADNRQTLADFLRSRRLRLQPDDDSSGRRARRRTSGLRREEVAGISINWYVRLEQGRAATASPQTADGLIRALKLTETDARHLKALMTGKVLMRPVADSVPVELEELVRSQNHPAYLQNSSYEVLVWNRKADELFGFAETAPESRNVLTYLFADPRSRKVFGDQRAAESARVLAQFRSVCDRSPETHGERRGELSIPRPPI